MSKLGHAESFRDLVVYKNARKLAKSIFELTKSFPKEEMYSLTDQVRRSSRSVGAQIAEAWAKRRYKKHFVSNLLMLMVSSKKHNIGSKRQKIVDI